jgi:ribosome-associated protein
LQRLQKATIQQQIALNLAKLYIMPQHTDNRNFETEMVFAATRSSGPGGQNVNKVSTKIELRFSIEQSTLLSPDEKNLIRQKLANLINNKDELLIVCQTERSQFKNKEKAIERFYTLINKALTIPKDRRLTKPTLASKAERLSSKRINAQKKTNRRWNNSNME